MTLQIEPIGTFRADKKKHYELPRQSGGQPNSGTIELLGGQNFEQALEELSGFSHIWLVFWFHEAHSWKPKVQVPRSSKKRALFATRSPHRPNPIGLSSVRLMGIEGRLLLIADHDLVDETPILDIKPYLAYADSHPDATEGWLQEEAHNFQISVSPVAKKKWLWLQNRLGVDLLQAVQPLLQQNPYPSSHNRIKLLADCLYCLAYKTWRVHYLLDPMRQTIEIVDILSGYTLDTLDSTKRYEDHEIHREFLQNIYLI